MTKATHNPKEMSVSEIGINLIKHYEGFSEKAYFCPAGHLTIGYGHLVVAGDNLEDRTLSEEEAVSLLVEDLSSARNTLSSLVSVDLTQGQYDALVSWVYNLGYGRLKSSTMLRRINAGRHPDAAVEMKRWVYGGGEKLPGLIARREVESFLYLYG